MNDAHELPEPSLLYFVASLATQGRIALGDIANPVTGESRVDLRQAKFCIDHLEVLDEKTEGNRTPDESQAIENVLHDLRMRYMEASD